MTTQLAEEFLLMTDRFSMAHSVEARVPFLDRDMVELVRRIPAGLRTKRRHIKYLLKRSVADLLPPAVLQGRKRGFVIPTAQWLRGPLRPLAEALLAPDRLRRQGLLQAAFYQRFVEPHLRGAADYSHQVWTALMFQLWYVVFIESKAVEPPAFSWEVLC